MRTFKLVPEIIKGFELTVEEMTIIEGILQKISKFKVELWEKLRKSPEFDGLDFTNSYIDLTGMTLKFPLESDNYEEDNE